MMKVRMGMAGVGRMCLKCEFSVAVSKSLDRTLGAGCLITHNSADGLKFYWTYYVLQVSRGTSSSFLGLSNSDRMSSSMVLLKAYKGKNSVTIRFMLWKGQVTCRSRRWLNGYLCNAWEPSDHSHETGELSMKDVRSCLADIGIHPSLPPAASPCWVGARFFWPAFFFSSFFFWGG